MFQVFLLLSSICAGAIAQEYGTDAYFISDRGSANYMTAFADSSPSDKASESTPPVAVAAPKAEAPPPKSYPDYKITGFFQLDSIYFGQSSASQATLGDIQDGTGFRRARLAATGNINERSTYMFEMDIAQGQARFVDVWGQVADTPLGKMRIGRFRQPFGMSELTSIRELPFLERPVTFALAPFRQTGLMFFDTACDEKMTWAVSGFRTVSDNFGNVYGDNGGYGTAERLTGLLIDNGDCGLVHLGIDHSYLDPARNEIQLASQDQAFVGQNPLFGPGGLSVLPLIFVPPFVNTAAFPVDNMNHYNAEAAISLGNALVQSEYRWSAIKLPGGQSATVHGGYLTARWVLTGETIPYNRQGGVFGRVKPACPLDLCKGQYGAWEIASQLSSIDLNPLFGLAGVTGPTRRLNSASLGLNWYWFNNAKVQMEWINGNLADPVQGKSVTNTFASRIQFDF